MTRTHLESAVPVAARLRTAWGLAAAGAVLLVAGPLVGVVGGGVSPAYTSWPLLAALALLPVAVSGLLIARGRPLVAAGLIAAVAVFAPGRILMDLELMRDALAVSRPELVRSANLTEVAPAAGLWLLVAGHVLILVAGLLAAGRAGAPADEAESSDKLGRVVLVSSVAAIALLGAPFTSTDPFLLARGPWEMPLFGLAGGLLVAAAAPLAAAFSVSSPDPDTRRGGLIGVAVSIAAIAAPPLVAGLVAPGLGVSWGPVVALLAAALLVLERPERTVRDDEEPAEVTLPGVARMHATTGVLGVLAGAATIAGAVLPQLTVEAGLTAPENFAAKLLWPAGIAVGALALGLLARGTASAVRPAFLVSLAALPLTALAALSTVLAASQIGAEAALGFWLMAAGLVLAAVAGICGGLAGAMEREDAEPERQRELPLPVLAATFIAALLAIGAFALPALRAPDLVTPGLFTDFRVASWGLLVGLLAVLAAVAIALKSRPPRAAALLCGAAVVAGVRLLELPLTGARTADAMAGPGTWLAAATVVALLAAAALRASER